MEAVLAAEALPRRLVLVAVVLAHYADPDGGSIRPSIATIEARARTDRRNVQRYVRELEQLGVLLVVRRGGAGAKCCSEYRLDLARLAALDGMGGTATAHDGPEATAKGGSTTAVQEHEHANKGGTKGGSESGSPTARSRKGNEERAHAHERAGPSPSAGSAGALDQVKDARRRELGALEAEYGRAGFRRAMDYETPSSYRTAFGLWRQERRAAPSRQHA